MLEMTELDESVGLEFDAEQIEDEAPHGRLVVVCGDHADRTVKEGDGRKVAMVTVADSEMSTLISAWLIV